MIEYEEDKVYNYRAVIESTVEKQLQSYEFTFFALIV